MESALRAARAWFEDEVPSKHLDRFRIAFAAIWLAYDLSDLAYNGTWTCMRPDRLLSGDPNPLVRIQLALVALEIGLLVGWFPFVFAFAAIRYISLLLSINAAKLARSSALSASRLCTPRSWAARSPP